MCCVFKADTQQVSKSNSEVDTNMSRKLMITKFDLKASPENAALRFQSPDKSTRRSRDRYPAKFG